MLRFALKSSYFFFFACFVVWGNFTLVVSSMKAEATSAEASAAEERSRKINVYRNISRRF